MSSAAIQAVKSFRIQQLKNLKKHVSRFGPLPPLDVNSTTTTTTPHHLPNPFVPRLNPLTRRWAPPIVSLRRQADLIKHAKQSNTLYLLPPGPKVPRPTALGFQDAASEAHKQFGTRMTKGRKNAGLEKVWMNPVVWDGKAEFKEVVGAELGTRLYAGKKRMFKGHKWERLREQKEDKKKILMRDMARRVRNYKAYYHKRKPDPLKTVNSAKTRKLPF